MCTWANTQNMDSDKLDWELTSQEADKHYSTPHSDHTLGTEKGNTSASHSPNVSFCALCHTVVRAQQEGCGFNSWDSSWGVCM